MEIYDRLGLFIQQISEDHPLPQLVHYIVDVTCEKTYKPNVQILMDIWPRLPNTENLEFIGYHSDKHMAMGLPKFRKKEI